MPRTTSSDSLASLDSHVSSLASNPSVTESEEELQRLQREWDEQVGQFRLIMEVVAMPFLGKLLGRKTAYWLYARWLKQGWTASFFVGEALAKELTNIEAWF